ncbi:hypothetical protein CBL_04076 [Carabus blaptoides fortunei]
MHTSNLRQGKGPIREGKGAEHYASVRVAQRVAEHCRESDTAGADVLTIRHVELCMKHPVAAYIEETEDKAIIISERNDSVSPCARSLDKNGHYQADSSAAPETEDDMLHSVAA